LTAIRAPWHAPLREFLWFRDSVDRGRGPVETKGTPKATEPLFRAGLSVGFYIVRQSEIFSI